MPYLLALTLVIFSNFEAKANMPSESLTERGLITLKINGIRNPNGKLLVSLHRDARAFPSDSSKSVNQVITIHGTEAVVTFENVAFGTYAISFFHDENGDLKLDRGIFGIPSEGTGASNDAKGKMGPPNFEDAKFHVGTAKLTLNAQMNY